MWAFGQRLLCFRSDREEWQATCPENRVSASSGVRGEYGVGSHSRSMAGDQEASCMFMDPVVDGSPDPLDLEGLIDPRLDLLGTSVDRHR